MAGIKSPASGQVPPGRNDPFKPLSSQLDQFNLFLQVIFDDPEETIENVCKDILELPPEERFGDSISLIEDRIEQEVGSADVVESLAPDVDRLKALKNLSSLLDTLIDQTLDGVWYYRDAESYIVLSAGYSVIQYGIDRRIEEAKEGAASVDVEQMFSATMAYFCRLWVLAQEYTETDQEVAEADDRSGRRELIIRDVYRTMYYVWNAVESEEADREEGFEHPSDLDFESMHKEVRALGAAVAYARLNISIGRGAELAGVSRFEFEDILDRFSVEPRYGPQSVEELYEE